MSATRAPRARLVDPVVQQRPVRKPGETVAQGKPLGGAQPGDEQRGRRAAEAGKCHRDHERVDRAVAPTRSSAAIPPDPITSTAVAGHRSQ